MKTIELPELVNTTEDFLAARDRVATTPEGGAAIFIYAMLLFEKDEKLGMDAFTIALARKNLKEDMKGYKGFAPNISLDFHLERFSRKLYWGRSYVQGTSPEDRYSLPPAPYKLLVGNNKYSEHANGDVKVFVDCTGADSPRPVTMRKNDKGFWKVFECSSLFVGIRPPEEIVSDDL